MKKLLTAVMAGLSLTAGCVALTGCKTTEANDQNVLTDELKVGKYYLENGSEEQYIEVYDDGTICLFGYDVSALSEDQIEVAELFTTRNYYTLSDVLPFIGLSKEPKDKVSAENGNNVGYQLVGGNCIGFSPADGEKQYYYYQG